MGIDIDLAGAVDPNAAIDEGTYTLEVIAAELTESKAGNAMVKINWQVIGHEEHTGHIIFENYVLEGAGAKFGIWGLKSALEALDVELGSVEDIDFEALVMETADALVEKNPPQGEYGESNSIKIFV